ncbi:CBS domain-containing protein [Actinokineospora sp. HUAS TT18]|uniref:CBS domain-containing protein n=1 Tax=Actinokineospora sp. HUAS TT18 TaxID=3447451 RepID=UPI003F521DE1
MTTARDLMTPDVTCVRTSDPVIEAARTMARLGVGSLPIRGEDDILKGMITDRDIVVKVLAEGKDPMAVHTGDLAQGEVVTVNADDDAGLVMRTMAAYGVRRVPVMDDDKLVGIIAQADVARSMPEPAVGDMVGALSIE